MNHLSVIKHTLFPFQERDMNLVISAMYEHRKICFCAHTSYGKTYSFCTVAKWFVETKKQKVVILCHREELVSQAKSTCINLGLTVETVLPSTKRMHHVADVYICMEMTLFNRLKKNKQFLKNVGLVIIDEAHSQLFLKHINFFTDQKILGFTATPVLNDRITYFKCERCNNTSDTLDMCCGREMYEWSKPKTMSMFYDDIVLGASIDELIEVGQVVRDINYVKEYADLSRLKLDSTGEFSKDSQNQVFGSDDAVFNVVANYEQICKGKKTMVFNPSSKVNKLVYDQFKEKGYNCKIYDSVNEKEESRKDLVKWFNDNDDAILININCFTTGFDSREVQAIIINRKTSSLGLFLQICGRGARSSNKIYKDSFIVIDGGNNIEAHNKWSDPNRDWRKIFFEGIGKDRAKKETPLSVQECKQCGCLFTRSESTCPNCGWKVPIPEKRERVLGDEILAPIDKIPLPNGKKIIDYTLSRGEGKAFAFKVLTEQIIDLFRFNLVSKAQYMNNKKDGRLSKRLSEIIRPVYFVFLNQPEFKEGANRTLKWTMKKVEEKLDKYYGIT